MLQNLFEIKAINPITKDLQTDIGIINTVFETRIMDLKNIKNLKKTVKVETILFYILNYNFSLINNRL